MSAPYPPGPAQAPEPPYQPDYGQPDHGYDQPGYAYDQPAHAYGQPGFGYVPPPRTNVMAILGLVFAFVFSPLGIVFSAIGLHQTKRRREGGRGLALAGLIVSVALLVIGVLVAVVALPAVLRAADAAAVSDAPASASAPAAQAPGSTPADGPDTGTTDAGAAAGGGPDAVVAACRVIVPGLTDIDRQMSSATTPRQVQALIEGLRQKLETEAGATHDATFIRDATKLSADFAELLARAQAGEDTSAVLKALAEDATTLGVDCGMAGWTN